MKLKKLLLCFICFFLILFLNGCKVSKEINNDYFEKKQDFNMLAVCEQNGLQHTMSVKKNGNQIQFEYISPENIKGLSFVFDSEKEKVSYMGLDINEEKGQLLTAIIPEIIATAISDSLTKPGDNIDGVTEYGNYNIIIDRTSGLLKTLTLPNYKFKCTFKLEWVLNLIVLW